MFISKTLRLFYLIHCSHWRGFCKNHDISNFLSNCSDQTEIFICLCLRNRIIKTCCCYKCRRWTVWNLLSHRWTVWFVITEGQCDWTGFDICLETIYICIKYWILLCFVLLCTYNYRLNVLCVGYICWKLFISRTDTHI